LELDRLRIVGRASLRAACLAGLSSLAVAGCGGSSSSTSTGVATPRSTPTTPTTSSTATSSAGGTSSARAKFITQADQVCAAAERSLVAPQKKVDAALKAEQSNGTAAHRAALSAAVRETSSVARAELARFRALSPPAVDRQVIAAYLAAVAGQAELVNQLAAAVSANKGSAVTTVGDELAAGKTRVDQLAQAYGFNVCGAVTS
jgi:hypothetical protein